MSETGQARIRAGVVAIAPVLLLIGFLIPYIGDITDNVEIATEIGGRHWARELGLPESPRGLSH